MKACTYLPLIFLGLLSVSCNEAGESIGKVQVIDLGPAVADQILAEKGEEVVVLDVRTPEEVDAGHIENSLNINFYDQDFSEQVKQLDPSKTYLVHCAKGAPNGRSRQSVEILLANGAEKVYHLNGGFTAWEKAGKSVRKSGGEE